MTYIMCHPMTTKEIGLAIVHRVHCTERPSHHVKDDALQLHVVSAIQMLSRTFAAEWREMVPATCVSRGAAHSYNAHWRCDRDNNSTQELASCNSQHQGS